MSRIDPLQQLRSCTAELVAQRLRSAAAVIARLEPLIDQAVQHGHAHRSIHEAITAGGLTASWSTYRIARQRKRKAQRLAQVPAPAPFPAIPPASLAEPSSLERREPLASAAPEAGRTSSTTDVLAALQRARITATKDYSRIAREEYRRRSRAAPSPPFNPSRKDPS